MPDVPDDEARARALKARKNLKRLAKAREFEAYEAADLRRNERMRRPVVDPQQTHRPAPDDGSASAGQRKGLPSQRGK